MEAGRTLLIVDDEHEVVDILVKKLEQKSYHVLTATTGKEALAKITSLEPDLILMDIVLPDLDGAEVVKRMQQDPATRYIPVIFLSGIITQGENNSPDIRVGSIEYSAIGKPFYFKDLLKKIEKELSYRYNSHMSSGHVES